MRTATILLLFSALAAAEDAPHLAVVTPPAAKVSVEEAIKTGVEFLVKNQNKDGSFGRAAGKVQFQLWCHVPGGHMAFKGASTALAWMGLQRAPYQTDASKQAHAPEHYPWHALRQVDVV